jgi:hypothetical protein
LKVTVPVGLNPPVTVATSWILSPTCAPSVARVVMTGCFFVTTTFSFAALQPLLVALLFASPA